MEQVTDSNLTDIQQKTLLAAVVPVLSKAESQSANHVMNRIENALTQLKTKYAPSGGIPEEFSQMHRAIKETVRQHAGLSLTVGRG